MGFISDNFAAIDLTQRPYTNYRAWAGYPMYLYHYILRYNSTYEILKINPGGTTETGLEIIEHETYLGRFTTLSIGLRFAYKSGGGGDILKDTLYSNDGVKSECTIEKYKLNPLTNDYDIYFTGVFDFKTYKYDVDENGAGFVTGNIIEQSDFQKLSARDEIKLNLESNTSVGGVTVTDVSQNTITFTPINYYRDGSASGGSINRSTSFTTTGTVYSYYEGGTEITDRTGGRFDFDPTNGRIYENTYGESITMKIQMSLPYSIETDCGTGSSITVTYQIVVYNSGGTPIQTEDLDSIINSAGGSQIDTGTLTNSFDYVDITVPIDGYIVFRAKVDVVKGSGVAELTMNFTGTRLLELWEKSSSIGSTTAECYSVYNAFLKVFRLIMDRDDCFESSYLTNVANNVYYEYITSGRNIRGFPDSWVNISLKELFEHVRSIWQIAIVYDSTTNRFQVVPDTEVYSGSARLDLGTITNLSFKALQYPSELKTGYEQQGDIEALQGVFITHLTSTHSMYFKDNLSLDLRGSFIMSGYMMEYLRRLQYASVGQTDTKYDDSICYVYAPSGTTATCSGWSGWEGITENYNPFTTARQNILRNRFLEGYFNYETGGVIRFVSNKKNVSYTTNGSVNEQGNIGQSSLTPALYLPEQIEGELTFTPTIMAAITSNIYGVWTVTDEAGEEYDCHLTKVVFQDFQKKIKITAKIDA